jgi:hypothetical protein
MKASKSNKYNADLFVDLLRQISSGRDVFEGRKFLCHIAGQVTRNVYGYTRPDASMPGEVDITLLDTSGREIVGRGAYRDAQVDQFRGYDTSRAENAPIQAASEIAKNVDAATPDRVAAIHQWMADSPRHAASFILEILASSTASPDFRDAMVFLAEKATYPDPADRARLATTLKNIASELLVSRRPNIDTVVWSAVRRFASILPESQLDELRLFLTNSGGVDTRVVALQGIVNAHESKPALPGTFHELRDRVHELAVKLTDCDVLTPGDASAVLELAICALYALGDPRAEEAFENVNKLGWRWLSKQVERGVRQLKEGWNRLQADAQECS